MTDVPAPEDTTPEQGGFRVTLLGTGMPVPAPVADRDAEAAFLGAGGDPRLAKRDVPLIVSAAARDHPDWFWRPARERIAREERWWKARGVWPPPKDRSAWLAELNLQGSPEGPRKRKLTTKIR